jgi:copper chaperone CopZ
MQNLVDEAIELSVEGMTCSGCAKAVNRALSQVSGVTAVTVDLETGRARVEGPASPDTLVAAVARTGFGARPARD